MRVPSFVLALLLLAATFGVAAPTPDPLTEVAPSMANRPPDPVPTDGENIIVIGGVSLMEWEKFKAQPHDNWWANFVRAGRIRTQQIRAAAPDATITWLVYKPSYVARSKQEGRDVLPFIESVGQTYNAKIVYFSRTSELIDYMNNGPAGRPRSQFRIASWEFFGHSNKACLMFDYSNNLDSGSKCWLHEKELAQIQRGVFTRNAFVKSWGCYCGELFVKSWYKATGTRMWGAIGKTQYMTEELPVLAKVGARWVR
jgi:hypothetical protein